MAVCSVAAIAWLVRTKRLRAPSLRRGFGRAAVDGVWAAAATIAYGVVCAAAARMPFAFHFDPWSTVGNLVSNAEEEIAARGLVFAAAWYATGRVSLAALVSGAVFGLVHEQYPLLMRLNIAAVGAFWSWVYARTGNLVAPWLAHEIFDLVLDLIL
jgi:membrane protease YdiL (CAAX protease family)